MAGRGAFVNCVGVDIAEGALRTAADRAAEAGFDGIEYKCQDVNQLELQEDKFDMVWAHGGLHHIENLEHVYSEVCRALRPDGLFILHEYVGPSRFQFDQRQRELIQACFLMLPARLRVPRQGRIREELGRNPLNRGWHWTFRRIRDKVRDRDLVATLRRRLDGVLRLYLGRDAAIQEKVLPTMSSVIAVDPSEAVRSDDILSVLHDRFDIIEHKHLGGAILQFLLDGIAGNLTDEAEAAMWVELLFEIEDALMDLGEIRSDFDYVVARPRAVS